MRASFPRRHYAAPAEGAGPVLPELPGKDGETGRMTPGARHLIEQARVLTKRKYGTADPELVLNTLAIIADRFRHDASKGYVRAMPVESSFEEAGL